MVRTRPLSHLPLTAKIVFLVALMGVISIATALYTTRTMGHITDDYQGLIDREAQSALHVSDAALLLGESSRLVYAVLTEQDENTMRAALATLQRLQAQFEAQIDTTERLVPGDAGALGSIRGQAAHAFTLAARIVEAAARWRGDRALEIIHGEFEPALRTLQQAMNRQRDESTDRFRTASVQLGRLTSSTILYTALAVAGGLALVIALSTWVAVSQISRPITLLTRHMERLTDRHYDDPITGTDRRDEVGTMAKALKVFKDSMQREDRLAVELAASAEARRLSEQLIDLTSAIPGAVFQLRMEAGGKDHRFLFVSEKAGDLQGRSAQELLGLQEPLHAAYGLDEASGALLHEAFAHSLRTLEPLDFDVEVQRGEHTRWIKTLATARALPDGAVLFNGVWLDVTEQRNQARALAQVAEEKATFLAVMSHEIRTPLNAILGLAQLALKEPLPPAQQERVEQLYRAGRRLLGIVDDTLDFSKIDGGHLVLEHAEFDARQLLADLSELFEPRARDKGLALRVGLPDAFPAHLVGDAHRIAQILMNFVNNAIKFTETGEVAVTLEAAAQEPDGTVVLRGTVRDTGIGLTPLQREHLFQPFHQADATITRRFGGTGLGLAISRRLARHMGGDTGVDSTPGLGSTFWFTVRVRRAADGTAPAAVAPALPSGTPAALAGRRVLLVDDNELNRLVATGLLEAGGLQVDTANDGAQALERLARAPDGTYDAVLMDMQMPVMDGLTATRRLRDDPRFAALPVIAMTANAAALDVERARAAGMDDHLPKPVLELPLWTMLARWIAPSGARGAPPAPAHTPTSDTGAAGPGLQEVRSLPAFDAAPLEDLAGLLSSDHLAALRERFVRQCDARMRRIDQAWRERDWPTLRQEAHDWGGTAGSFGLERLGGLTRLLEEAAVQSLAAGDGQAPPAGLLEAVREALGEGLEQLQAHALRPHGWRARAEEAGATA
ncbi:multi-sensor hybrid histidine kinase [Paracidovorax avenae ATCC 19860]|uniref:Virulence sensor protein BvgS n=1 Tax=Paracidovorax avenae (strain ATCC 19860 / DSM 7227 / CCUG 15838 / JCM 20985 / LMG 2117 / NCPPB 1011) TaxID=643561 RepID=F0Q5Y8_PARA1|nr:ATP-binding protein [Paracidovorax avenae]ADX48069.1 multi-sensor hybrid histidine kinase [Paracidovorax avenae ATCC 19860]